MIGLVVYQGMRTEWACRALEVYRLQLRDTTIQVHGMWGLFPRAGYVVCRLDHEADRPVSTLQGPRGVPPSRCMGGGAVCCVPAWRCLAAGAGIPGFQELGSPHCCSHKQYSRYSSNLDHRRGHYSYYCCPSTRHSVWESGGRKKHKHNTQRSDTAVATEGLLEGYWLRSAVPGRLERACP